MKPKKTPAWLEVLKSVGPLVLAGVPGVAPFVPVIIGAIAVAEETQRPGADKRAIGAQSVRLAAEGYNLAAGREVIPVDEASAAYDTVVDSVVQVVNVVDAATGALEDAALEDAAARDAAR